MDEQRLRSGLLRFKESRREVMLAPEDVSAMLRLKELGWGTRRIARELGVSRNTVKGYIVAGGWAPYKQPRRGKQLDGQAAWRQCRRHPPGVGSREGHPRQSSHARAGGAAVSARTCRASASDDPL